MRKWQADIRAQQRALERQIRDIERDRKLAEKQVREAAKRGDMRSAKMLAREIVHTRKVRGGLMGCWHRTQACHMHGTVWDAARSLRLAAQTRRVPLTPA